MHPAGRLRVPGLLTVLQTKGLQLRSKLLPAFTAIVVFAAGPTHAADNFANIDQAGDSNSGVVTQGPGDGNNAGTELLAVRQDGDENVLNILQSGDDNSVGTAGTGFLQTSNRSTATITQSSDGNSVGQVTQTGIDSTWEAATLRRNVLTILQEGGDDNAVGVVTQTRSTSPFVSSRAANSATLTQSGEDNDIGTLIQSGYAEAATVTQTGDDNGLDRLEQRGSSNLASITVSGNGNGRSDFASDTNIDGAWRGLAQGQIYQNNDFFLADLADANTLTLTVTGDSNSYGFSQIGTDNTVTGLIADGDGNQAGAVQLGISNIASFTLDGSDNHVFIDQGRWVANIANDAGVLITGSGNDTGVLQSGTNNVATVTITGGDNRVNIDQESLVLGNLAEVTIDGGDNGVTLTQANNNSATVRITGSSNQLVASQDGLGNTLTLTVWGSGNNALNSSFSGVALATSLLTTPDLVPGRIAQTGAGNSILYDVGTSTEPADGNRFAFSQIGTGNQIVGSTKGSNNQVVIVQNGASNFTSFSQNGIGNIIGVSQ